VLTYSAAKFSVISALFHEALSGLENSQLQQYPLNNVPRRLSRFLLIQDVMHACYGAVARSNRDRKLARGRDGANGSAALVQVRST